MTLPEKIDMLMKSTGDNKNSLSKKTGIPYSTINNLYERGKSGITIGTAKKLCEYFGVTLDYLAYDEPVSSALADDEIRLLGLYRSMNQQGRDMLLASAESFSINPVYQKDTQKRKEI